MALAVIYSHGHLLGGFGTEPFFSLTKHQTIAGTLAVLGFFGLSGFLVTSSLANRKAVIPYIASRALRIFPGLYFSLFLTAFLLAPLIAYFNESGADWSFSESIRFCLANALIRVGEWHAGHVIDGLPYPESINGALWSLFPECCCYAVVLFMGLAGVLYQQRLNLLLCLFTLFTLHAGLTMSPNKENIAPTLIALTGWSPFFVAFGVGSAAYLYRNELAFSGRRAVAWSTITLLLLKFGGWALVGPLVFPITLVHLGHSCHFRLNFDFSYGIYILHFPIMHLLSSLELNQYGIEAYLALSTIAATLAASVSWFLVEKPALRLKKWNRLRPAPLPPK